MQSDLTEDVVTSAMTSPGVDPLIDTVIDGRFKVVELIGTGGMGRVYRAVQSPLNRAVAIKVLDYNYGPGKESAFRQRFLVEAALTSKLNHHNTITVIDYGCTQHGLFWLAMEYLAGETLDHVLSSKKALPWRRVLTIGQQVARSLREAHNLGVVHRDLKPANVMLLSSDDDADMVKVLDFGLVKSFVEGHELEGRAITQQGMLMGSPPYMAPEQGERNLADPRSDIYSLGVVLFEALSGQPPFSGKNDMQVILDHVNKPVPPLRAPALFEPVPPAMVALVLKCLAKSPMDRFQTMEEVLAAMHELASPQTFATPGAGTPQPPSAARRNRVRTGLAIGAFVGAVALSSIITGAVLTHPAPTPPLAAPLEVQPSPTPAAVAPAPPPAELPAAEPVVDEPVKVASVTFHLVTEPPGAVVTRSGLKLGRTPIDFELPPDADGRAATELTFTLGGYHPLTIKASGSAPGVDVSEKLTAMPTPPRHTAPTRKKRAPRHRDNAARLDDDEDDAVPTAIPDVTPTLMPSRAGDGLKKPR